MAVHPIEIPEGIDPKTAERYLKQVADTHRGQHRLEEALERAEVPVGPGTAWQLASSERLLRRLLETYGGYTAADVARLRGGHASSRSIASTLARKHNLLGVPRGRGKLYPAFQFRGREVDPAWQQTVAHLRDAGSSDQSILLWAAAPNSRLGASPAELVSSGRGHDVLQVAEEEAAEVW